MVEPIIRPDGGRDKPPPEIRDALDAYRRAARLVRQGRVARRGRAELERLVLAKIERHHGLRALARRLPEFAAVIWAEASTADGGEGARRNGGAL